MNFMNGIKKDDQHERSKTDIFTELITRIETDLYNIAKNKVYNINDIDDILQETILKIYKNFNSLKNENAFRAWAIKILLNECNKTYKKRYKDLQLFKKMVNKKSSLNIDYSISDLENELNFKELLKCISTVEQNIFILYYQCNYSIKNISEILNINENTIKSKLKRSKAKIK